MREHLIFGFGSLINTESLKASVPDAKPQAACIKGFRRSVSLWDPAGFTTTNLDLMGIPFCALDVTEVPDKSARVNGVVFSVDEASFQALQEREAEYKLLETICYDYHTDKPIGTCLVYSANKNSGQFVANSKAQDRYLQICLDGAKEYSDEFYEEFLTTTYINEKTLKHSSLSPEFISTQL